jgi:hypothetical protein
MAPRAAVISSAEVTSKTQTYLPKISVGHPETLPVRSLICVEPGRLRVGDRADHREHDPQTPGDHQRRPTLTLDRLDEGVGGVDTDEHEDEEEEHHHGAGVDEDLDDAEEVAPWRCRRCRG